MRKLKVIAVSILSLIVLAFLGGKFYFMYYFLQTPKSVTVEFRYIRYACGDCYPRWNVIKFNEDTKMNKSFYNKDMQIYYKGKKLDDVLNDEDWDCVICSKFIVTGKIEKTLSGKYKFLSDECKLIKDKSCCDN
jgi:hypothetical protein